MTLFDTWKNSTDGSFQAAVHLIALQAPTAVTGNQLARLLKTAARGGWVGEYEWGKVEAALRATPDSTPPPAPPPGGRGDSPHDEPDERVEQAPLPPGGGAGGVVETSAAARRLHKLHAHHHALLIAADTDADRAVHATKIMQEIIPALDKEYDRIRSTPPPSPPPKGRGASLLSDPDEPVEQGPLPFGGGDVGVVESPGQNPFRRLQTLRVRLSKLKHLIPAAQTMARRQQLETEQAEKQAEVARLENLLA